MNTPTHDNVHTHEGAREKLIAGANKVADAVKLTLGAAGANAVLESDMNPGHRITNDGVSIAQSIYLSDPVENMGANVMKEIATRADKESGDGTTTATVIARAIINEGKDAAIPPMQLKRELDECLELVYKSLDDKKKEITVDEVGKIAAISAEDENLGALLQEIYQKVGKEGVVELDNSNLPETFYEIVEGVRFRNAGYFGYYSLTEPGRAVYEHPQILVSKEKITAVSQIEPLVSALMQKGHNQLVIFCEDIDMSVASRLALTHNQGIFKTLLIKAPTLFKDWFFEDFAKVTGATVIDSKEGKTFKTLTLTDLGTCDKIISSKDETRIIGTKDIADHLASVKEGAKEDENLHVRAAWLQTKVAILKMGANSESELSYKRLKAIDAISASHLALEEGVVPGGGVALSQAAATMPDTTGGIIMKKALTAPINQIMDNTGIKLMKPITMGKDEGYDVRTMKVVNMWEAGILDPVKVVKNSVKSAVSTASTLLTSNIAVTLHDPSSQMPRLPQA